MSAIAERTLTAPSEALRDVPPFPPVATRLMQLVSEEGDAFSYKEGADLIRADAAFSVELLRLANSPVFGFRYEIKDIPHAIVVLGMNRLRAVVTTLAMREFLSSQRQHETIQQSWRHNLATALACEVLAGAFWVDGGLGYTAGLLHDIGLLAMAARYKDAYADLLSRNTPNAAEFLERERQTIGIDHCEAGEWLTTEWELPGEFRDAAANHHRLPAPQTPDVTALVHLGCLTASMAGFPVANTPAKWEPELIIGHLHGKLQDRYRNKLEDLPITIATKINSFDCDFMN